MSDNTGLFLVLRRAGNGCRAAINWYHDGDYGHAPGWIAWREACRHAHLGRVVAVSDNECQRLFPAGHKIRLRPWKERRARLEKRAHAHASESQDAM